MSLKHIAKYRAEHTGNTVEEEMQWLRARSEIKLEKLFGVDENNSYLKYEWMRKNNRLGGKYNERRKYF